MASNVTISVSGGSSITVGVAGQSGPTATVTAGQTAIVTVAGAGPNANAGKTIVSSGGIADLTTAQQSQITQGVVVVTSDGYRFIYSGAGSVTSQASYVLLADITPEWSVIAGKPSTFPPESHTHAIADVSGLQTDLDGKAASAHVHGSITNSGAIGTTADLLVGTGTGGVLQAVTLASGLYSEFGVLGVSFGTGTNNVCRGNDARLSDARTPLSHTHGNISNSGTITTAGNANLLHSVVIADASGNLGVVEKISPQDVWGVVSGSSGTVYQDIQDIDVAVNALETTVGGLAAVATAGTFSSLSGKPPHPYIAAHLFG